MGADPKRQQAEADELRVELHKVKIRSKGETISWIQGYIGALEELLRETSGLRPGEVEKGLKPKQKAARWNNWFGSIAMWKSWRRVAGHKLHLARSVLSLLEEQENGQ